MSITCTVCGTVNPEGTKFCEGCGVELTGTAPAATSTPAVSNAPHFSSDDAVTVQTTSGAAASSTASTSTGSSLPVELPPLETATPVGSTVSEVPSTPAPLSAPSSESSSQAAEAPAPLSPPLDHTPSVATDFTTSEPASASAPLDAPAAPTTSGDVLASAAPTTAEQPSAAPSSAATSSAPAGEAKLGIKKFGAPTGETIPLQGERLVVGRFDASTGPVDIDLSGLAGQEHISRRHAELYREGGTWYVRDLGSTNGVYIKRKGETAFSPRLQEPAALSDGDELAFGNVMLTFQQG